MISYSQEIIGYINVFERITRARVKDCFIDDNILVFVIEQGDIGKALGKAGSNIHRLSNLMKKKIKLIEYNINIKQFIINLIYPIRPIEIVIDGKGILVKTTNNKEKGQIYGREKSNLKKINELVKKYFKTEIRLE
ncbi:MAG: NusA-like transcription termination signal-binding factor [archaeon]